MPDTLYGYKFGKNIKLPPVTLTSCGLVLTEPCAEILQRFRLGETQMSAMSFYDYGLQELVDDKTYYFLNIAEWRKYLIYSECSDRVRPVKYPRDGYDELYNMAFRGKDNIDYAVSEEALHADVDIWHDPKLNRSIFMSAALKQKLDKAKMSKVWKLVSCKLIGAR